MVIRALTLALLLTPIAVSISLSANGSAQPAVSSCPPMPAPTQDPLRSPETQQARVDKLEGTRSIPKNARLLVPSFVEPPERAAVEVRANGVLVPFERAVRDGQIEIAPKAPLPERATLIVSVSGIRTATFRVEGGLDHAPPVLSNATVGAVSLRQPGPTCPPTEPTDRVDGTIDIDDASGVTLTAELIHEDARRAGPVVVYGVHRRSSPAVYMTKDAFIVRFAAGTLAPGEHATLRLVATDVAGNVSAPLDVELAAPAPAAAPSDAGQRRPVGPAAPVSPARRGCG